MANITVSFDELFQKEGAAPEEARVRLDFWQSGFCVDFLIPVEQWKNEKFEFSFIFCVLFGRRGCYSYFRCSSTPCGSIISRVT